jgi:alanine racemase
MVKANGYGHGAVAVANALQDADALGVARIYEALALRQAGIIKPIVLMEGFFETWELPLIVEHGFEIVIHQMPQVQALLQANITTPIPVWLKLESGMHRLGLPADEFLTAWQQLQNNSAVASDIVLMTHLACSEETTQPYTAEQIHYFNDITHNLSGLRSIANSAAIIAWPDAHADWVRPGIMLYGISPFADKTAAELDLQPVMTLSSRLLAMHQLKRGDAIGYNRTFICSQDMPVGIAAVGYGDGYPRYIPAEGTPILVNGYRTQIIGRVSMDMLYIDLRGVPTPRLGDPVILWGEGLPIERIAQAAQTNSYELVCGVTSRVEFVFEE